jgi:hypothetical protein
LAHAFETEPPEPYVEHAVMAKAFPTSDKHPIECLPLLKVEYV